MTRQIALAALGLFVCSACTPRDRQLSDQTGGTGAAPATGGASTAGGTAGISGAAGSVAVGGMGGTGIAGASGTAGVGSGGISGSSCTSDGDCDDDDACNGTERCVNDSCQKGVAVDCSNLDSQHCVGECVEQSDVAVCVTVARDADDDGHGTELCAAAPGDDCDDGEKTVYFGAPEICDGLDNDCDDLSDLEDRQVPNPNVFEVATARPLRVSLAYAPTVREWALVWDDPSVGSIHLQRVKDGAAVGSPTLVADGSPAPTGPTSPQVGWDGTNWGVVWNERSASNFQIFFRGIGPEGVPLAEAKPVTDPTVDSTYPSLSRSGLGAWLIFYSSPSELPGATGDNIFLSSFDGDATTYRVEVGGGAGNDRNVSVTNAGGIQKLVWSHGANEWGEEAFTTDIDPLLNPDPITTLAETANGAVTTPRGGPSGDSTMLAWANNSLNGSTTWVVRRDGGATSDICGPSVVLSGTDTHVPVGLAPLGSGTLLATAELNLDTYLGRLRLALIDDTCSLAAGPFDITDSILLATGPYSPVADFVGSPDGYALAWVDASAAPAKLMLATFGEQPCAN